MFFLILCVCSLISIKASIACDCLFVTIGNIRQKVFLTVLAENMEQRLILEHNNALSMKL